MVGLPIMLLVIFGYAARYDVANIDTIVVGPDAPPSPPTSTPSTRWPPWTPAAPAHGGGSTAQSGAQIAIVTGSTPNLMLIDGTELFVAQSALRRLPAATVPQIMFNPSLSTANVMVPSLIGLILLFIGTVITSLGVVREREQGTLEHLAVMPLRPMDVTIGTIASTSSWPLDMALVTTRASCCSACRSAGSPVLFVAFGLVFPFVVLGLGVAISTVSKSQGEAVQLAIMALLPQVMLSGMIFPLASMAGGVR